MKFSLRQVFVIAKKELTAHIRDRRSILAVLFLPILGPLCFALSLYALSSWMKDQPLELPVQGSEKAPALIAHLTSAGIAVRPIEESPEAMVKSGKAKVGLIIEDGFEKNLQAGIPAVLTLVHDSSRNSAAKDTRRVHTVLAGWSGNIGGLRLLARGIDPKLAQPALISSLDVATPAERAAQMLMMIPLFLMMSAFIGGQNLIIDMTAGERERGSLEPLLMTAVFRLSAVVGKWAAGVLLSAFVTVICLIGFAVTLAIAPLEDLRIPFTLNAERMLMLAVILIPLSFVGSAAELAVSTFAKSFKEAQTWLSFFSLIPAISGIVSVFRPFDSSKWMSAVPVLAQQALAMDVLKLTSVSASSIAIVWLTSIFISAVLILYSNTLFRRESVIYGR